MDFLCQLTAIKKNTYQLSLLNNGVWERTSATNFNKIIRQFNHSSQIKSSGDVQLYRVTRRIGCFGTGKVFEEERELLIFGLSRPKNHD